MKILTIDVGNTNIKMEVFDGSESIGSWFVETTSIFSEEKFIDKIEKHAKNYGIIKSEIKGCVLSSVVPEAAPIVQSSLLEAFGNRKVINVTSQTKTGITVPDENRWIGSDRIAGLVAASTLYGTPAIVIDLGTATVFSVIDEKKNVLGGQIIAGGNLALNSLMNKSSNISKIVGSVSQVSNSIKAIPTSIVIGRNTEENIIAGAFWSLASQVEGICTVMKKELEFRGAKVKDVKVILSGGLSKVFTSFKFSNVDYVDHNLVMKGLRLIGEINFDY